MFKLTPKIKPKWYEFRKQLSRLLIWCARKVNPKCEYNYSYYMEQISKATIDSMVYDAGMIEVKHRPISEVMKDE